jgi:hypothetical protein
LENIAKADPQWEPKYPLSSLTGVFTMHILDICNGRWKQRINIYDIPQEMFLWLIGLEHRFKYLFHTEKKKTVVEIFPLKGELRTIYNTFVKLEERYPSVRQVKRQAAGIEPTPFTLRVNALR